MNIAPYKKALVPLVVAAVSFVLTQLDVDVAPDQLAYYVALAVTAVLTFLTRNG